jgi:hypothetical protein
MTGFPFTVDERGLAHVDEATRIREFFAREGTPISQEDAKRLAFLELPHDGPVTSATGPSGSSRGSPSSVTTRGGVSSRERGSDGEEPRLHGSG